jgi:hypothetical protein
MYLIQILLPVFDNDGRAFATQFYDRVQAELTDRFGGVTAFRSAPAEGVWKEGGAVSRDAIIIFEVMTNELERNWWTTYRADLEARFNQERIIARAIRIEQI